MKKEKNTNKDFTLIEKQLFENAVFSIQNGVEDYQSDEKKRSLSAVRNFYSGVLLLGKSCLLAAAPKHEALKILSSKFEPELDDKGDLHYVPVGTKTIDFEELKIRFKKFKIEWPKGNIQTLQKLRNDLEHFHPKEPHEKIRQIIAECFPIVESFFKTLNRSPINELGDSWKIMIEEKNFFQLKKQECESSLKIIDWPESISLENIECAYCTSPLLYQVSHDNTVPELIKGKCESCGERFSAGEFVQIIVAAGFARRDYSSCIDTGESVIHDCPECRWTTYVYDNSINICFFCGHKIGGECARCSEHLNVNNMSVNTSIYCSYCDYIVNKDD